MRDNGGVMVLALMMAIALAIAGCQRGLEVEVASLGEDSTREPAEIVFVTPTEAPTRVPTAARVTAMPSPVAAGDESESAEDAVSGGEDLDCEEALRELYTVASEHCLNGAEGHFCNGGGAPIVEPQSDVLRELGSQAEAIALDSMTMPSLFGDGGSGLLWLRLEESVLMNALLIGGIRIRSATSAGSGFVKWQSIIIESEEKTSSCEDVPGTGMMVAQGIYGRTARVVINGVSARINGTVIALTQGDATKFIAIEGETELLALGQSRGLKAGEQVNVGYEAGDWSRPTGMNAPTLLEYDLVKRLPVALFDRPVPIPQPGYAQTQGGVNMRMAPDITGRLLFQVPAGETMSVLGVSGNREWLHIRLGNGETGWMSAGLLAKNLGELSQVYDQTPLPPQRYGELAWQAYVNVGAGGNLREAPDTAFRVKRTLPYGSALRLLARSPYSPWVKVESEGEIGWMALFTLRTKSVIGSLPIDYNVPFPPRATATPVFSYGGGHAYPDPDGGY